MIEQIPENRQFEVDKLVCQLMHVAHKLHEICVELGNDNVALGDDKIKIEIRKTEISDVIKYYADRDAVALKDSIDNVDNFDTGE